MPDREKIIYSIERCISHVPDACRDCAYDAGHPYNECVEMMLKDALALLKEQEESEARLLTAEEVRNMKAGTAFGIETYYDHDGKRMPGCTWALRTESLIISFFGTMFPDTVSKIPYNTLEENENTGEHEKHQYRFWSRKPTFEQCEAVKWE